MHNHGKFMGWEDDNMCMGESMSMSMDFMPNNDDHCMGMEDGEQTDEYFSQKCANNHMYKTHAN